MLSLFKSSKRILRSLKTARPLLASVAYFMVFAMVLFSYVFFFSDLIENLHPIISSPPSTNPPPQCRIIGVQLFKGSLRRMCYISPTNGETSPIQNSNQWCGGYIDPGTLETLGYIQLDGSIVRDFKGYVCPLGQICTVCISFPLIVFFLDGKFGNRMNI